MEVFRIYATRQILAFVCWKSSYLLSAVWNVNWLPPTPWNQRKGRTELDIDKQTNNYNLKFEKYSPVSILLVLSWILEMTKGFLQQIIGLDYWTNINIRLFSNQYQTVSKLNFTSTLRLKEV